VPLPDPLSDFSGLSELSLEEVLESFFVGEGDFFSSFVAEGLGLALGSTLFFGDGFGVGLGESLGVGVALGFGRAVGVGVGDGIWISLLANATLGAGSGFSILAGVGDGAGVLRGSAAAEDSLLIQTTVCKFAGVASRLPRASARRMTR
jgi:hypothetical protein